MILVFKHLFYRNYVGLSLWPFIILRNKNLMEDAALINHERIHLRQQTEMLVVFFYIWYLTEWLIRSLICQDFYRAYKNISFEREAYAHEKHLEYLSGRKPFAFINYLFHKP